MRGYLHQYRCPRSVVQYCKLVLVTLPDIRVTRMVHRNAKIDEKSRNLKLTVNWPDQQSGRKEILKQQPQQS